MPAKDFEIPFPIDGREDTLAYSKQSPLTTRFGRNMRVRDSRTGRYRGASRSATKRYCLGEFGAGKIADLAVVNYDKRRFTWNVSQAPSAIRRATLAGNVWAVQVDHNGNVYAIDGPNRIAVFNSDLDLINTLNVPVTDERDEIHALRLDELGRVYCAVSAGVRQSTARIYAFEPDTYSFFRALWDVPFNVGMYVEDLRVRDGNMWLLCNDQTRGRSHVVALTLIDTGVPEEKWRHEIPGLSFCIDVNQKGEVVVGSTINPLRALDPLAPKSGQILDQQLADAEVDQLANLDLRKWGWWRAWDLAELYKDDDAVTVWQEFWQTGRDLYAPIGEKITVGGVDAFVTGPKFKKLGTLGATNEVRFNGKDNKLVSYPNPSKSATANDVQRTVLPAYAGGGFAFFMVVRPNFDEASKQAVILAQDVNANNHRRIVANLDPGGAQPGSFHITERQNAGPIVGAYASFDNANSAILLSFIVDSAGNIDAYQNGTQMTRNPAGAMPYAATAANFASLSVTEIGQSSIGASANPDWFSGGVYEMVTFKDYIDPATGLRTIISVQERQWVEGILAWRRGTQAQLDPTHPYWTEPPGPAPDSALGAANYYQAEKLLNTQTILTKLGAHGGAIKWVIASNTSVVGANIGGIGYGVAWNQAGTAIYSVGAPINASGGPNNPSWPTIRKIIDQGDTYSIDPADGAWSKRYGVVPLQSETILWDKLRIDVDRFDNVFIPVYADGYLGFPRLFISYDKDGNELDIFDSENGERAFAIAVDPTAPDYTGNPTTIDRPEYVVVGCARPFTATLTALTQPANDETVTVGINTYRFRDVMAVGFDVQRGPDLATTLANLRDAINHAPITGTNYSVGTGRNNLAFAPSSGLDTLLVATKPYATTLALADTSTALSWSVLAEGGYSLVKVKLVDTTQLTTSGRAQQVLGVCDGNLVEATAGGPVVIPSAAGAFDPSSRYVHSCTLYGHALYTDSTNYGDYDARTRLYVPFKSKTLGKIPPNFQIFEPYRGAVMAVRGPLGNDWALSSRLGRVEGIYDWDTDPPLVTPSSATGSEVSDAGGPPHPINGFIPIGDDLGIFLCDSSLWRLTGDPGTNGVLDQIPSLCGGAFGRAWCFGPQGQIFFWGSQGGLFVMAPGGIPQPVSDRKLERLFQDIDLTTYYVRMAWNWRQDGLDVFLCPYGSLGGAITSFAWERKTNSFWEDDRSNLGHEITSLCVVDGDRPNDRYMLMGGRDGGLRTWDEQGQTDDGTPIQSQLIIGPLSATDGRLETKLSRLQLLIDNLQGALEIEVFVSSSPGELGEMRKSYIMQPGLSPTFSCRVAGGFIWLKLKSQQRWAFESARALVESGAYRRFRATT
jgi:hypothetical protein